MIIYGYKLIMFKTTKTLIKYISFEERYIYVSINMNMI